MKHLEVIRQIPAAFRERNITIADTGEYFTDADAERIITAFETTVANAIDIEVVCHFPDHDDVNAHLIIFCDGHWFVSTQPLVETY